MSDRVDATEHLVQMLLAGTPDRVIDAIAAASPEAALALPGLRNALARLAFAVAPGVPSARARARLLAAHARPRRPRRPVLVVLDMIRDYLAPGGPLEVPRARAIVPAVKARLADARARGVPVVYVCDTHPADDPDFAVWPVHAVEGTAGADPWPEIAPESGDYVVRKRTYSAFTGSELGPLLDRLQADELILTGCATEVGLAATATDALQRGFVVTVPDDSQAGTSEIAEQVTLASLRVMPPFEPRYLRDVA